MSELFSGNSSRLQHKLFDDITDKYDGTMSAKDFILNSMKLTSVEKKKQDRSLSLEQENFVLKFHKYSFNIKLGMEVFNTTTSEFELEMMSKGVIKVIRFEILNATSIILICVFFNTQELRSEIFVSFSWQEDDEVKKLISDEKDKFAIIDTQDLKFEDCHQKFPLTTVGSIHARFQDSIESMKQKVKSFLDFSLGDVPLCFFDSVIEGKNILGPNTVGWKRL